MLKLCLFGGICFGSNEDNSGLLSFSLQSPQSFLFALVFQSAVWVCLHLIYGGIERSNYFVLVKYHIILITIFNSINSSRH